MAQTVLSCCIYETASLAFSPPFFFYYPEIRTTFSDLSPVHVKVPPLCRESAQAQDSLESRPEKLLKTSSVV